VEVDYRDGIDRNCGGFVHLVGISILFGSSAWTFYSFGVHSIGFNTYWMLEKPGLTKTVDLTMI
jgi:hypothetical protein